MLTPYLRLVQRLIISGAVVQLSRMPSWHAQEQLSLLCLYIQRSSVARYGVLTLVTMKRPVFCDVLLCSLLETYRGFVVSASLPRGKYPSLAIFVYRVL